MESIVNFFLYKNNIINYHEGHIVSMIMALESITYVLSFEPDYSPHICSLAVGILSWFNVES